jgi:hypothetical protein
MTYKCRRGATELPELPTSPITSPVLTGSPAFWPHAAGLHVRVVHADAVADVKDEVAVGVIDRDGGRVGAGCLLGRSLRACPMRGRRRPARSCRK